MADINIQVILESLQDMKQQIEYLERQLGAGGTPPNLTLRAEDEEFTFIIESREEEGKKFFDFRLEDVGATDEISSVAVKFSIWNGRAAGVAFDERFNKQGWGKGYSLVAGRIGAFSSSRDALSLDGRLFSLEVEGDGKAWPELNIQAADFGTTTRGILHANLDKKPLW